MMQDHFYRGKEMEIGKGDHFLGFLNLLLSFISKILRHQTIQLKEDHLYKWSTVFKAL